MASSAITFHLRTEINCVTENCYTSLEIYFSHICKAFLAHKMIIWMSLQHECSILYCRRHNVTELASDSNCSFLEEKKGGGWQKQNWISIPDKLVFFWFACSCVLWTIFATSVVTIVVWLHLTHRSYKVGLLLSFIDMKLDFIYILHLTKLHQRNFQYMIQTKEIILKKLHLTGNNIEITNSHFNVLELIFNFIHAKLTRPLCLQLRLQLCEAGSVP